MFLNQASKYRIQLNILVVQKKNTNGIKKIGFETEEKGEIAVENVDGLLDSAILEMLFILNTAILQEKVVLEK